MHSRDFSNWIQKSQILRTSININSNDACFESELLSKTFSPLFIEQDMDLKKEQKEVITQRRKEGIVIIH
ncbi:MAG: hypothetical protein IPL98_16685 [Saprospiraceae bacterium]|nr:hypothetical protein [Saprospiraceae bacterium]